MIRRYDIGFYPMSLWVSTIGSFDKCKARFKMYPTIKDMDEDRDGIPLNPENKGGVTYLVIEKKTGSKGVLILISEPNVDKVTDFDFDVSAHESVHAADAVFDVISAYSTGYDEGNEPYAYLVGYIAGRIGSYLIEYTKSKRENNE